MKSRNLIVFFSGLVFGGISAVPCCGQGFADIPPAPTTPEVTAPAAISFDLLEKDEMLAPPAASSATVAPLTASSVDIPPSETETPPLPSSSMPPNRISRDKSRDRTRGTAPVMPTLASPLNDNTGINPNRKNFTERTEAPFRQQQHSAENLRSNITSEHPFARYISTPNDTQSLIKGKPFTVAELLNGTRSPVTRRELLETYWELLGLLVEYNIRKEAEQFAGSVRDAQQTQILNLLQQQRRGTEAEFAKKQWELTENLKLYKGTTFAENALPIPCDVPVYKNYETYADKIAHSERAKYLGRLIPVQRQLVDARQKTADALYVMLSATPSFTLLNQRMSSSLEMVHAVVDYNKIIAQYTAETVRANVNQFQLVGAVIELQKNETRTSMQPKSAALPEQPPMSLTMTPPAPVLSDMNSATIQPEEATAAERIASDFSMPPNPIRPVSAVTELPPPGM